MKSDSVISCIQSFIDGDRERAESMLRIIEADETNNNRHRIADKIRRLIKRMGNSNGQLISLASAPDSIQTISPDVTIDDLVLPPSIYAQVKMIAKEWSFREQMLENGVSPRARILMHGPSGNGKTSLAGALANLVGLPLAVVDLSAMLDSHLGCTAKNIAKTFNFVRHTPCVLFFDEADAICGARTSESSAGSRESNRTINQLLMDLDQMGTQSIVVFATNFSEVFDAALNRRIQVRLELPPPDVNQLKVLLSKRAEKSPIVGDLWSMTISTADCQSFAEFDERINDAVRMKIVRDAP